MCNPYNLKLHEFYFKIDDDDPKKHLAILKVPGGWIYGCFMNAVFVPSDKQLPSKKEVLENGLKHAVTTQTDAIVNAYDYIESKIK